MTVDRGSLFIDGGWVAPSTSSRTTVLNAATEEVLGTVRLADVADVDRAVAAARNAVDNSAWSQASPADRAVAMTRFADELQKRSGELARTVNQENGMPIGLSEAFEGGFAIGLLRYYADLAATLSVEDVRPSQMGLETVVRRSPAGVVAAIVPWNSSSPMPLRQQDFRLASSTGFPVGQMSENIWWPTLEWTKPPSPGRRQQGVRLPQSARDCCVR
jgi:acyl-CoA reductase-like NAD-dependent aldehyde dehydrogenase